MIDKRLINQQEEFSVTLAKSRKRTNCPTELTFFAVEDVWTGTETSCEEFKMNADHLFGAKASLHQKKISPKNLGKIEFHSIKELKS